MNRATLLAALAALATLAAALIACSAAPAVQAPAEVAPPSQQAADATTAKQTQPAAAPQQALDTTTAKQVSAPATDTPPAAAPAQAPQAPDTTAAKQTQPTAAPTQPPLRLSDSALKTATPADTAAEPADPIVREVGYRVGMAAPEFGMTLADGSQLTSAMLVDEGKPVLLYFHSTT